MVCKEIAEQWLLVCFQVNHGSVIVTVNTSGTRDQTSSANVIELVLLVQQDVSAFCMFS